MFGSDILDVAIGLIFVYLLVSILCSAIREGLESWLKTRAAYLEHGIRELMRGTNLTGQIYTHPQISGLFSGNYVTSGGNRPRLLSRGGDLPSYIPSKNFALALMDLAARGPVDGAAVGATTPSISLESIRANLANIPSPDVQRVLLTAIDSAQGSLDRLQKNLENWYDSGMDRVSGWYKRSTQWIIFVIGLVVAVGMNVNTLTIVDYLYVNDAAREAIVAKAQKATSEMPSTSADAKSSGEGLSQSYEQTKAELEDLKLPIGWDGLNGPRREDAWTVWITAVFGWLLTALAASMGAPFWFDLLNKVMVIRSTVKPHEKSPEESSEDRQKPTTTEPTTPPAATGAGTTTTTVPSAVAPEEENLDGCDVSVEDLTSDEQLPAAEGGVQS